MSVEVVCEGCNCTIERYEDDEPFEERREMCPVCRASEREWLEMPEQEHEG
jgi:hypothetical protein